MLNRYLVNFNLAELKQEKDEYLVIGTGIAGLTTAINLSDQGRVILLGKEELKDCNTEYAQGGIAAAISKEDKAILHYTDTLKAGAGLCNPKAVDILVKEGSRRIYDLIDLGVGFDRKDDGISLTQEGAHSCRRILHAGGDATGREIRSSLARRVRENPNIQVKDRIFVIDLLVNNEQIYGVLAYDQKQEEYIAYLSSVVVLATGGAGELYQSTSNPKVATGDGIALAYRAGAKVMDLEFIQFHPTTLELEGVDNFLISESVRGEGAVLRNHAGERFMSKYHELADLAPRDIVARAIYEEMKEAEADCVYLDLSHLNSEFIIKRFPTIYQTCLDYGIDITKEYIPVAPAAHYLMGGILTNTNGETNIEGLFACGETASIGIHGANRLASNSLLDGLVYGKRVADRAIDYIRDIEGEKLEELTIIYGDQCSEGINIDIDKLRNKLKDIMSDQVGIIRTEGELRVALAELEALLNCLNFDLSDVSGFELQNLITVAYLTVKAALVREESRGAHYRSDFPESRVEWEKHTILQKDNQWEELSIEFE
ncbi:L-aspartate oxidase [Orenia marismortui]|uniref:L-aspartate oxidase n=1 Tax=Orenia marismortui TaxID=46469 RepID=UPI0003704EB6|nr:L-aspartate oxidase [Orenia marismortui]